MAILETKDLQKIYGSGENEISSDENGSAFLCSRQAAVR